MASAPASTMPKGAPGNLASGGSPPVATASGKLAALASARPVSSCTRGGSTSRKAVFSGSGAAKRTSSIHSLRLSLRGAMAGPCAGCKRAASATARGTGALKRSTSGRSGRHGDCAFSRSQLNSASRRGRTFHSKRCTRRDTRCGCPAAATPAPQTRRTPASAGKGRWQASSTTWRASASRARWRSSWSRTAPSTRFTGRRSPRPSTSHHTARCTLAASTAPFRRSRKCWSSSMREPG